jgi:hypothetical protein
VGVQNSVTPPDASEGRLPRSPLAGPSRSDSTPSRCRSVQSGRRAKRRSPSRRTTCDIRSTSCGERSGRPGRRTRSWRRSQRGSRSRDDRPEFVDEAESGRALTHPSCRDGASRARTGDLLDAIQTLSQLSYGPTRAVSLASNAKSSAQLTRRRWLLRGAPTRMYSPRWPSNSAGVNRKQRSSSAQCAAIRSVSHRRYGRHFTPSRARRLE